MKAAFLFSTVLLILLGTAINAQTLTDIDPDSGEQCQRLSLTLTGEDVNFFQGTTNFWLESNGTNISATSQIVLNENQVVGIFYFNPQHAIGSYDVSTYVGGEILTLVDGFFLNPVENLPHLIGSQPDTAELGETFQMLITGEYTHFDASGIDNNIILTSSTGGYISSSSVTVVDAEHLEATIYVNFNKPTGNYHLEVSNPLDGELIINNALFIVDNGNSPEIVSVEPNIASQGQSLTITVTGRNTTFDQGSSSMKIEKIGLGSISATSHTVVNDTLVIGDFTFNFSDNPGLYDVKVSNYQTNLVTLVDGFELFESGDPVALVLIEPNVAYQGTSVTLLVMAENTHFDTEGNTATVTLKQGEEELYGHNINVIDSVQFEADFVFSYANYTGYRDLIVNSTLDGEMTLTNSFQLLESESIPSIMSVVPDSANQGDNITISVTGKNIIFMQGTSNLNLSMGSLTLFPVNEEIINDTVINGEFDFLNSFPVGKYDVNIINDYAWPDLILTDGFTLKLFTLIDEENTPSMLTVYPNPSNGLLNVKRNFKDLGEFLLEVYDINGRFILEERIGITENEKQLNLTALSKGTYLLKIKFGDKEQTKQFLIR